MFKIRQKFEKLRYLKLENVQFLTALTQKVLQTFKKSLRYVQWNIKMYWILPNYQRNFTFATTLIWSLGIFFWKNKLLMLKIIWSAYTEYILDQDYDDKSIGISNNYRLSRLQVIQYKFIQIYAPNNKDRFEVWAG